MLYFREDDKLKFEKKEVEDTFLVERRNGRAVRAWAMYYQLLLPFTGYKGIPQDEVTVAFARDIVFDPFNILPDEVKPQAGKLSSEQVEKPWIRDVSTSQFHKRRDESSKKMALTTQVALLGTATVLMFIAVFIVVMINLRK
jgi:hypothetical protein